MPRPWLFSRLLPNPKHESAQEYIRLRQLYLSRGEAVLGAWLPAGRGGGAGGGATAPGGRRGDMVARQRPLPQKPGKGVGEGEGGGAAGPLPAAPPPSPRPSDSSGGTPPAPPAWPLVSAWESGAGGGEVEAASDPEADLPPPRRCQLSRHWADSQTLPAAAGAGPALALPARAPAPFRKAKRAFR